MYSSYQNMPSTYYPYGNRTSNTQYNNANANDRLAGGFLGPFILGGITGGVVAPFFWGGYNRPQPYPPFRPYPPYPPYPPPFRPY